MKAYAIALIVIACCVAVIAVLIILRCLFNSGRKKKETNEYPNVGAPSVTTPGPRVTVPLPQRTDVDVEKGERKPKSSGTRDGGMVILGGAAGLATGLAIASVSSGCGGGGGGGCGAGCGGGGCGAGCGC